MSTQTERITTPGARLPAPGEWRIDPGHAQVSFEGRHLMLTKVRGSFTRVDGTLHVAEDPEGSSVEVVIDMASVESGSHARDEHLRSADLFDVERHPTATFRSTLVEWDGTSGRVTGDLTIKGVTRPVTLDAELVGTVLDFEETERAVFSASATVDREDWGVSWNAPLVGGGLAVSRAIRIEIDFEAVPTAA